MEQEPERIRPELSGADIMRILDVEPGPQVGRAYQHMLTLRLERGEVGREGATAELLAWAEREGIIAPGPESGLAIVWHQLPESSSSHAPDTALVTALV
jgi:hypothetical protein